MPKGKVKSFLVVNDIFKLAMKSLLGKGWTNLPQSEKCLIAPSLFIQAGAWLQRATSDGCDGTGAVLEGAAAAGCPFHLVSLQVSVSGCVTTQRLGTASVGTELISAAPRTPTAAWGPGCVILPCLLFLSTSSRNLLHLLLDLEDRDV